jgi:hypothetical protein
MTYLVCALFSNGEVNYIDVYPAAGCYSVADAVEFVNEEHNYIDDLTFEILYVKEVA